MSTSRRFGAFLRVSFFGLATLLAFAWIASSAIATGSGANGRLLTARAGHTATALPDGTLLIAGGTGNKGPAADIEFFNLAGAKSVQGPKLFEARSGHTATLLPDGRVLLAGGNGRNRVLDSTEIYDPLTGGLEQGLSMNVARAGHTATVLADGRVLFAGGDAAGVAEIYNPRTNSFSSAGKLATPRSGHSAVQLASGHVLLVGGHGAAGNTAEIFDPVAMTFTPVRGGLKTARVQPTLKVLSDGKVQVYGGDAEITMEIYNPDGYFSSRGHMLRDSGMFWAVAHSPGQAALINVPAQHVRRYAQDAHGSAAETFERSGHTATEVAAKSMMVIAGGTSILGRAVNSVDTLDSCAGTVTTDLTDYYPGQTVIMSGSGWMPGEQITLNLHRDTNDPPDTVLYATADENGDWINAEYVVQEFDLNVTFVLTATGDSGCTAQTTFTDAPPVARMNFATAGLPVGTSVSVTWSSLNNGGNPISGTQTFNAPGPSSNITTGASVAFNCTFPSIAGYTLQSVVPACPTTTGSADTTTTITATYVVSLAPTTTTITSTQNPSTYGDSVTFTASVVAGVNPVTSGSVTFIEGGTCAAPALTLAGPTALNGSGQAAFSTATLAVPSHTITACYGGTASFAASSGSVTQVVNKATPTVTAGAGAGNPYTFDGNPHTGTCTVTGVGGADLGPLTATHTPTDPPVDAGSYTVHCDYPGSANYASASNTTTLTINQATPTVVASAGAGNPYTFDGNPHTGTCTVTGVGGADLGPLAATHTPSDPPVNAGSYTVHCDYPGSTNYASASNTTTLTINQATPTVVASAGAGNPYTYDANPHTGTCTVTGVGGADLGPLAATHTPDDPPINAGSYTVHCDYPGSTNYEPASNTATLTINKATPTVVASAGAGNPYTYDTNPHTGTCTVTGVGGVDLGPLTATHTPTDPPVNAGTYTVHCDYPGSANYLPASATATLTIQPRDALVNYIGQTTFVTSGSSSTTAQVTLSASVQDPTGTALVGAKMDFIDISSGSPGKVLAHDIPVSPVPNSAANTGTANTIVTLSTGQYGADSYLILVRMTGNYDNTDQAAADKTATVVVAKPAITNQTTGAGNYLALSTAAGTYAGNGDPPTFTVGMSYNKSGSNLQGKITLSVPQADGVIYVKSNSISSMAVKSKAATIYTKATVYEVLNDNTTVTIDGNVTLRMDVLDGAADAVGFTVLSSKGSTLYYSNNWVIDLGAWKTAMEAVAPGGFITVN